MLLYTVGMQQGQNKLPAHKIVEEVFNSVTHGLGAVVALVGLLFGVFVLKAPTVYKVGFLIFCGCLVLLMTISSLYHALFFTRAKEVFRRLDHSSIFLLIAGSYTPFVLSLYTGPAQWLLLVLVWACAITGVVFSAALPRLMKKFGMALFITFGWVGLLFVPKLGALHQTVILYLLAGGILYTLGAVFLAFKKPFMHMSWHVFVVAAASMHFVAIWKLV